jgi:hypothetical protein
MSPQTREHWTGRGIPPGIIERLADFEDQWGGLLLPPSPRYDGGPKFFRSDVPEPAPGGGWWFEAGDQRASVPYGFMVGPGDEFGILGLGDRWVALHASVAGWVEAVALAYHVRFWAANVTTVTGAAVDDLDLTGLAPVAEVEGLADTWWWGEDTVVAVHRGEMLALGPPDRQSATVHADFRDPLSQEDFL